MKALFRSIASNLEYLQRITKYTYFFLNDTEEATATKFYKEHVKVRYFGQLVEECLISLFQMDLVNV